jgi:hypothetical protein
MSMTEILEELPRLGHSECRPSCAVLSNSDAGIDIETPEMLAAIDAAVLFAGTGSGVPLSSRQRIADGPVILSTPRLPAPRADRRLRRQNDPLLPRLGHRLLDQTETLRHLASPRQ